MKTSKYKNLIKNLLLFCISNLIPKLLAFILIPIYTYYLTTAEYGRIDLVSTTIMLLTPIISLNISDALLRFLLDKEYKHKDVFSIAIHIFIYDILIDIFLLIILLIFNPFKISNIYYIYFSIYLLVNILYSILCIFLKGIENIKVMVRGSVINSFLTFVFMILLLCLFHTGINGYMFGSLVGMVLSICYMCIKSNLKKYISFKIDKSILKKMIIYSFPMIFSAIAWWINNSSDRYILVILAGVSVSGVYAVSSKIPGILKTFQNIFLQAWSISAIKEFDKEDKDGFIGNMYSIMNFLMIFVCSILILFNLLISKILYSKDFFIAWQFVPPLLVSVVFDSLALFLGSIYYAAKDTKTLSIANIIGAIFNVVFNLILISKYGAYGASIATLLSYFITFVICIVCIRKHIIMKTNYLKNNLGYILIITQMIAAYFGNKYIFIQVIILFMIIIINSKNINDFLKLIVKKIKERKLKKL